MWPLHLRYPKNWIRNTIHDKYFEKIRADSGLYRLVGGQGTAEDRFDPVVVKTEGMNMDDPRLRGKQYPVHKTSTRKLPVGQMPILPTNTYIADVRHSLIDPLDDCPENADKPDVRFQVVPEDYLEQSILNARFITTSLGREGIDTRSPEKWTVEGTPVHSELVGKFEEHMKVCRHKGWGRGTIKTRGSTGSSAGSSTGGLVPPQK